MKQTINLAQQVNGCNPSLQSCARPQPSSSGSEGGGSGGGKSFGAGNGNKVIGYCTNLEARLGKC